MTIRKLLFAQHAIYVSQRQSQFDGKGFKFHASPRQAFLPRQKLMQYECSSTDIHNKVNMYTYIITFYPSDARNETFDRESSIITDVIDESI